MATKKTAKKTPAKNKAPAKKRPAAKKSVAKKKVAKKAPAKRAAAKKSVAKKKAPAKQVAKKTTVKEEKPIGRIAHYFDHIQVAVIKLESGKSLKVGEKIRISGGELDFEQKVESLQVDHQDVPSVKAGDDFGTKIKKKVHEGYRVFRA